MIQGWSSLNIRTLKTTTLKIYYSWPNKTKKMWWREILWYIDIIVWNYCCVNDCDMSSIFFPLDSIRSDLWPAYDLSGKRHCVSNFLSVPIKANATAFLTLISALHSASTDLWPSNKILWWWFIRNN